MTGTLEHLYSRRWLQIHVIQRSKCSENSSWMVDCQRSFSSKALCWWLFENSWQCFPLGSVCIYIFLLIIRYKLFKTSYNASDLMNLPCRKYNLKVIIDLHAAPGSQNALEHSSSRDNFLEWGQTDENIKQTVAVIEFLSERYTTIFLLISFIYNICVLIFVIICMYI